MFENLRGYLEEIHVKEHIPACDCIVYKGHHVVFRHMVGYRDAEKLETVRTDDKYLLYSATKPLTMTAVMQLIERGYLKLTDELCQYLPEFKHMYIGTHPAKNQITIEHLMTMRAGFNYDLSAEGIQSVIGSNPNATLEEVMKGLARQPLDFEPGTHFQYSLCHDVLGRVIEVVSGMTYGEYMKKNIFEPLGMIHTGYSIEAALSNLTAQYIWNNKSQTAELTRADNPFRLTPRYECAGAGVVSTVEDYGKFVEAMCNYGVSASGVRILSKESIDMMRTGRLDAISHEDFRQNIHMKGYTYGLGVRTMVDKEVSGSKSPIGEFGWDGAAGAYVLIDVENNIGIFYAQAVREKEMASEIHPRIRDLVYEAIASER